MFPVSNADRVVFPEVGKTKGDVVRYYEKIAPKMLAHVVDRPISIKRFPKGLAGQGFFQKNVPAHYPESIGRLEIPRSREASKRHGKDSADFTVYPLIDRAEHLAYLANQQAIELHVPIAKASLSFRPDRMVIDLDPPPGAFALVRDAAKKVRAELDELGLPTVPVATGSKGYHLVGAIQATFEPDALSETLQQLAALLAAKYPELLTTVFRVAARGRRVFVDWLRNRPLATVIAPYSLRATPRATVAVPISWDELDQLDPNAFTLDDADRLLERPDSLAELSKTPVDLSSFVAEVARRFEASGLELEVFDRFRS